MVVRALVRPNTYYDSMRLMRVSEALAGRPGIASAAAVMATPLNIDLLAGDGLLPPGTAAGPEDLLVAVEGEDEAAADDALAHLDELLSGRSSLPESSSVAPARSLEGAIGSQGHNLAVIAVPGPYAALEAYSALRGGLHVFLFSDNVPLEDEVRLKRMAAERNLLMMGPDCGTAILDGVGLGFANRVERGPVGIVGASGTGIQQLCSLLDLAGVGVAQAIGTGGRDLSAAVGGSMTIRAVRMLEAESDVQIIAVISKPADAEAARRLHQELLGLSKPAVVCLLGDTPASEGAVRYAETLTDLAIAITDAAGIERTSVQPHLTPPTPRTKRRPSARGPDSSPPGRVYGLFTGGTLCSEAARVLDSIGAAHHLVDLGADQYTRGRAHPIMDPRLRGAMLADLAARDDVGAVLVDVILGDLAYPDPAGALISTLAEARQARSGAALPLVAVLIGARRDPQNLERQRSLLLDAHISVFPSNAQAALHAAELARQGRR